VWYLAADAGMSCSRVILIRALKSKVGAVAIVCVFAASFAVTPVEPVQAQGFLDWLFNGPRYGDRERNRIRRYRAPEREWRQKQKRRPRIARSYRIKSPKYYSYKPDALSSTSLSSLAEPADSSARDPDPRIDATPFNAAREHLASFRMRTLADVATAIKAHYSANPRFIWVTDGRPNMKARVALAKLETADAFGLSSSDYLVDMPEIGLGAANDAERQKRLVEFEMELSAKVLTYVLDATRGRVDPNRISGYHDFARKTVDLAQVLRIVTDAEDIGAYLNARHPDNPPFKALVAELADLRSREGAVPIEIAAGTFVRPGATTTELADIVAAIRLRGTEILKADHAETLAEYNGSPSYTPELVAMVRDFQRENGLVADGIVGRKTIRALTTISVRDKIRKVELAMERLRWLPHNLGAQYVLINQPAFTASYISKGSEPLTMRAVVGTKSNQTSFFMDRIERVEYHPYWSVPRSILVNEMLPKLVRNPSYLDRLGYQVTTASGRRVSSRSVNWYRVAANKTPISVRQPPGPKNALGELKILFPNKHAIYMHDTPAKDLFNREVRAFSHGCVRLQEPREMAAAVLGESTDYVASRISEGRNSTDHVTTNIPVYVAYFTAWPDPQSGKVRYFDDIYERDAYLQRAIERTDLVRHGES
jgi:murein L,D-transpeptidase YcbB/YkuD